MNIVLLPVRWETDATPQLGDRPQAIINQQIVNLSDVLIGIFHTRIGSPTGKAESGTIEEIRQFVDSGRPALLYFSSAPLPSNVDLEQVALVREFKEEMRNSGVLGDYATDDELRRSLTRHLTTTVRGLLLQDQAGVAQPGGAEQSAVDPTSQVRDEERSSTVEQLDTRLSRLEELIRRFEVMWFTERDSEPHQIEGGRAILGQLRFDLTQFRTDLVIAARPLLAGPLDRTLVQIASLERHQLFIDGGTSYREFWALGQEILDRLRSIQRAFRAAVEMSQDPLDPRSQEYLRSKKACLRLAVGGSRGFPYSTSADRVTIEVPIRNESEQRAYDIVLTVTTAGDDTGLVGTASLAELNPGDTKRLPFTASRPPQADPPQPEDRWYRFHISYRDGLGKDEASYVVHFTGAFASNFRGQVAEDRSINSPLCVQNP